MGVKAANNVSARLAAGITASQTTLTAKQIAGAFPALAAGDWFPLTVFTLTGDMELMRCTGVSGATLTVARGQEGTTAQAFPVDALIELRPTAAVVEHLQAEASAAQAAAATADAKATNAGNAAAAAQQTANGKLNAGGKAITAGHADTAGETRELNGAMASGNSDAAFQVRNQPGSTGDSGLAMIAFHAQGHYGIKMGLRADGYFGIGGWSRGAWSWYTDPSGNMTAAGNVIAYSDARLKTDIEVIPDALAKIEQVRGVTYTRTDSGERQTGVIAQELQKVLPEAVGVGCDENKTLAVAYGNIAGLLIEGIKELNARLSAVENTITRSRKCR